MGLPNEVNSALIGAAAAGGYEIQQSLRWSNSSSEYLSQSINSAPTSSTSATLSFWYKATQQDNGYKLFDSRNGSVDWGFTGGIKYEAGFGWGDATFGSAENATNVVNYWTLNQNSSQPALRDPSAWYHVVLVWDGNNGTSTRRMQVYVNNVESYFYNYYGSIGSGASCPWTRNGYTLKVGGESNSDYLMAELHCIDGQALAPTNFGEYDAITGAWIPKKYAGTYGNNGFYVKFDPSATNGIGHDHSGQGNHFTSNGLTTSGTGTDVMSDTPTNNFATLNPIYLPTNMTFADGNLYFQPTVSNWAVGRSNFGVSSGKWYCEMKLSSINQCRFALTARQNNDVRDTNAICYNNSGSIEKYASLVVNASSWGSGNVMGMAFDASAGSCAFYRDGVLQGTVTGLDTTLTWFPAVDAYTGSTYGYFNFGQRAFEQTKPTGYESWCTANLPEPTIKDGGKYFKALTYTGNGTTKAVTGVGFAPDFVWIKNRTAARNHQLFDIVRGSGKTLYSNLTDAESTNQSGGYLSSFDSDGFTVTGGVGDVNAADPYISWNWDAGGTGSSNTAGSITSTVSANPTAGFSIVTYTGGGSNGTVGHGLGVAPKCVIVKNRSSSTAYNWYVWHAGLTSASYFMNLNRTDNSETFSNDPFGGTAPTSTVFTVGGENRVSSVNYVAYCFSEVAGYSRIGTYVGTSNSDGPYVYCGFKPAWVMVRARSSGSNWTIYDNKRQAAYNPTQTGLNAASTNTDGNLYNIDLLSNGFKLRTSDSQPNYNGWTYIFIAFAELPFKYANAR